MKKIIFITILFFAGNEVFGQDTGEVTKLIEAGITSHDKGEFEDAIANYDKALAVDPDNLRALVEKGITLNAQHKQGEAIALCQQAIEKHPGEKGLETAFVNYASILDEMKQADKALAIFDEGLSQFPSFYLLHFNKGITLAGVNRMDEAMLSFQRSVAINPRHPGSHLAIANLLNSTGKRIPAVLAYCRFLTLETQSDRASQNLARLQALLIANVSETEKNSVSIQLTPDMLKAVANDGKPEENNFAMVDMLLSMEASQDFDKKNKKKTETEKFIRKIETICSSLEETKKDNYGFYWEYYAPYFIEMKQKEMVVTFGYIAFSNVQSPLVVSWLKAHQTDVDKFYAWSDSFAWKTN